MIKKLSIALFIIIVIAIVFSVVRTETKVGPDPDPSLLSSATSGENKSYTPPDTLIGTKDYSLQIGGVTRVYKIYAPPTYTKDKALPLVIYLHGGEGDMRGAYLDGMDKMADKHNFILAVPQGVGATIRGNIRGYWNGGAWATGECCGKEDDIGFIKNMIETVSATYSVDDKKIFATGISNGGLMTNRIGCELSDIVSGIAPVAPAGIISGCKPANPVAVLVVHGLLDPINTADGREPGRAFRNNPVTGEPMKRMTPAQVIKQWGEINTCKGGASSVVNEGNVSCTEYSNGCSAGGPTRLCLIKNMGHTYPSGNQYLSADLVGPVSMDYSFDDIWEFFHNIK